MSPSNKERESRVAEYLGYARDALDWAKHSQEPSRREKFVELAQSWQLLAEKESELSN